MRASHCVGFSLCGARAPGTAGSVVVGSVVVAHGAQSSRASVVVTRGLSSCSSRALELGLGSCVARAKLPLGMWDLPGPGIKPVSAALAGGFLTAGPPGKSYFVLLNSLFSLAHL